MFEYWSGIVRDWGLEAQWAVAIDVAGKYAILVVLSVLANLIAKRVIVRTIHRVIAESKTSLDNILVEHGVFTRLSHMVPAFVFYFLGPLAFAKQPGVAEFTERGSLIYMLLVTMFVIDAFLNAVTQIYNELGLERRRPIKGYIQVLKLVLYLALGILIFSTILDRSPVIFLSGLGALTAVLLLIFKDAILGFVAGIQISANDMLRPGDWIEMPKYGADGDVMEVSLTTVKVRNWDKTITTIPAYSLVSDSFKNWRGMEESGGRRIKRALNIDVSTIRFCTNEEIERFKRIERLRGYIEDKEKELAEWNAGNGGDLSDPVNGRRLTNIGTFRAYIVNYLRKHPLIHQDMTFLVRHLPPGEHGLPIEIYVFSRDQAWVNYEAIQADIFDHILAIVQEFGLRVYQQPSGSDIRALHAVP